MLHIIEDFIQRTGFAELAAVHDRHAVGHGGDDAHVVRDDDDGCVDLLLQILHQIENLRLNGHVQRGGRLIRNQNLRFAGQRDGDHHALTHAAGKLVRVLVESLGRVRNADHAQQVDGALTALLLGHARLVQQQHFGDLLADGHRRVEGGQRILEDHGDFRAANLHQLFFRQVGDVAPVEDDLAGIDFAARRQQAHDGLVGHGFARTGFADDGQRFALVQFEAHAAHGLDHAAVGVDGNVHIFDFKQGFAHDCRLLSQRFMRGSNASRRPSPKMLKQTMMSTIAMAG